MIEMQRFVLEKIHKNKYTYTRKTFLFFIISHIKVTLFLDKVFRLQ